MDYSLMFLLSSFRKNTVKTNKNNSQAMRDACPLNVYHFIYFYIINKQQQPDLSEHSYLCQQNSPS